MKTIDYNALATLASSGSPTEKPILVWFHSNTVIDSVRRELAKTEGCATFGSFITISTDGRVQDIMKHPEQQDKFIFPDSYNEHTRFFLYHRYLGQLKQPHIDYILQLSALTSLPIICCVEDYSKDETPDFDASAFEEYDFVE